MDLNFITKLTDDEWIALINFCAQHHSKKEEKKAPRTITWAKVAKEPERKDLKGNRYALVSTGDGVWLLNLYRVNDFCMATENAGMFGNYPPIILDNELRIFLTTRFGENYLKALESYHIKEMQEELTMLSQYSTLASEKAK